MFEVGCTYKNRIGEYQVLKTNGDSMTVRYSDGKTCCLSMELQSRIMDNMAQPVSNTKRGIYKKIGDKAYWTMGYLLAHKASLSASLTYDKGDEFKDDYYEATGKILGDDRHGIAHVTKGVDQWSNQGRVRFESNDVDINLLEFTSERNNPYPVSDNQYEVTDIKFLFFLLQHGFDIGASQDVDVIKSKIPGIYRRSFLDGYGYD